MCVSVGFGHAQNQQNIASIIRLENILRAGKHSGIRRCVRRSVFGIRRRTRPTTQTKLNRMMIILGNGLFRAWKRGHSIDALASPQ